MILRAILGEGEFVILTPDAQAGQDWQRDVRSCINQPCFRSQPLHCVRVEGFFWTLKACPLSATSVPQVAEYASLDEVMIGLSGQWFEAAAGSVKVFVVNQA